MTLSRRKALLAAGAVALVNAAAPRILVNRIPPSGARRGAVRSRRPDTFCAADLQN